MSSVAGSAMFVMSPSVVESGVQSAASPSESISGCSEVVELTSGSLLGTGSASGGMTGVGLTSGLLLLQRKEN